MTKFSAFLPPFAKKDRPGCTEHYVLHCYRSEPDFVPELSLVLEVDGEIIGHVMYAWSHIDPEPYFVAMRNPEAFEKYF